jgi:hypothetical protein
MATVFQVQAKDSIVALNAFATINAVQNLNLDPTFNEEFYSELGNAAFSAQSRSPETSGSFEVTSTGATASILARMIFDYDTQSYQFDPSTQGNAYTITETDLEYTIFDLINLKQPGATFNETTFVPYAQLTGLTIRVDAAGSASETFSFEADLQEAAYTPYHDIISVPLETQTSTTADLNTTDYPNIDSGTHGILYVFKDDNKFDWTEASWTDADTITIATGDFETAAPYNRIQAVLYQRVAGTFPTIYYPTTARFVRGDRADIWLVNSGTATADANRLLRCQSADVNVDLTRDKLQEIKRNDDLNTTYWRGLNYPLNITATANILETTLEQWALLQGKTLNSGADPATPDTNNITNLVDFETLKLVIKMYPTGSDTEIETITLDNVYVTSFSERQQVQGRAERTIGLTGSEIEIVGAAG